MLSQNVPIKPTMDEKMENPYFPKESAIKNKTAMGASLIIMRKNSLITSLSDSIALIKHTFDCWFLTRRIAIPRRIAITMVCSKLPSEKLEKTLSEKSPVINVSTVKLVVDEISVTS